MTETKFVPEKWSADILRGVLASQEFILGPKDRRRMGHLDRTPYTDAELQARDEAVGAWEQLTNELTEKGWLEHEACYECGGELKGASETEHTEWVHDETTDEYHARIALLPPVGTIAYYRVIPTITPYNPTVNRI